MRDPKRIDSFCKKLQQYWEVYVPDWRFGQLMSNFLGFVAGKKGDIWYIEEPEMSALLDEYFISTITCVRPIKKDNSSNDGDF